VSRMEQTSQIFTRHSSCYHCKHVSMIPSTFPAHTFFIIKTCIYPNWPRLVRTCYVETNMLKLQLVFCQHTTAKMTCIPCKLDPYHKSHLKAHMSPRHQHNRPHVVSVSLFLEKTNTSKCTPMTFHMHSSRGPDPHLIHPFNQAKLQAHFTTISGFVIKKGSQKRPPFPRHVKISKSKFNKILFCFPFIHRCSSCHLVSTVNQPEL
jgi:hypothetical protein